MPPDSSPFPATTGSLPGYTTSLVLLAFPFLEELGAPLPSFDAHLSGAERQPSADMPAMLHLPHRSRWVRKELLLVLLPPLPLMFCSLFVCGGTNCGP